jgi:hypothetical protein
MARKTSNVFLLGKHQQTGGIKGNVMEKIWLKFPLRVATFVRWVWIHDHTYVSRWSRKGSPLSPSSWGETLGRTSSGFGSGAVLRGRACRHEPPENTQPANSSKLLCASKTNIQVTRPCNSCHFVLEGKQIQAVTSKHNGTTRGCFRKITQCQCQIARFGGFITCNFRDQVAMIHHLSFSQK